MSQMVQINYQALSLEGQSICEVASNSLQEFDNLLKDVESKSSLIVNEQAKQLIESINNSKDELNKQVERIKEELKNNIYNAPSLVNKIINLKNTISNFSSQKIIEFRSLLNTLLQQKVNEKYTSKEDVITQDIQNLLNNIQDSTLRQFTYISYLNNNSLKGEELLNAGKKLMDDSLNTTYESQYEAEMEKIRKELQSNKVEEKVINEIVNQSLGTAKEKIVNARVAATKEIVDEKIRQKSLMIIIKEIKKRDFVVKNENITIKRDTNEVILRGIKPSGEIAEFRVFLDGKFIYKFDNYEGQACQNDIKPFFNDLENIYGIKVTESKEMWKNPDKISTMKYQTMNTNKNKG